MPEMVLERPTVTIETVGATVEMVASPETSVSIELVGGVVEVVIDDREIVEVVAPGPQGALGPEGPPGPPGPAAVVRYLGLWNALTNTPPLVSGVGPEPGSYYKVSLDGFTLIDGTAVWKIGDEIRWNGATWDRIPTMLSDIVDGGFF